MHKRYTITILVHQQVLNVVAPLLSMLWKFSFASSFHLFFSFHIYLIRLSLLSLNAGQFNCRCSILMIFEASTQLNTKSKLDKFVQKIHLLHRICYSILCILCITCGHQMWKINFTKFSSLQNFRTFFVWFYVICEFPFICILRNIITSLSLSLWPNHFWYWIPFKGSYIFDIHLMPIMLPIPKICNFDIRNSILNEIVQKRKQSIENPIKLKNDASQMSLYQNGR